VPFSDVDVELTLTGSAPPLEELMWLIDLIPNCHVASETFQPKATYVERPRKSHHRARVNLIAVTTR
jgi:hypothetical protein